MMSGYGDKHPTRRNDPRLCEHAKKKPTVCPCEADCACKKKNLGGTCLPGKRKSMRDDPEVRQMTALLNAGRASEREDILEELAGRLNGSRGWWKDSGDSPEDALRDFRRWVEARNR